MIEFFLILRAAGGAVGSGSFMRLLFGTLFMLYSVTRVKLG